MFNASALSGLEPIGNFVFQVQKKVSGIQATFTHPKSTNNQTFSWQKYE